MANYARAPKTMRAVNLDEVPAVSKRNNYNTMKYDEPPQSTTPYTNRDRYTPVAPPTQTKQRPDPYAMDTNRSRNASRNDYRNSPSRNDEYDDSAFDNYPSKTNPNSDRPEMYYIDANGTNAKSNPRATPPMMNDKNRASSPAYERMASPIHDRPEMYHIGDVSSREQPSTADHYPTSSRLTEHREHSFDDQTEGKATLYYIDASKENDLPDTNRFRERTPSPPIPTKKKTVQAPVSYDVPDDDDLYQSPRKPNPFPTPLQTVTSNVRYVPLSHSKASESIQRSMLKYRFLGN